MRSHLKQIALKFARSKPGGWMVWFILRYFPFLIPFKKRYQDDFIIAIPHPVPSYPTHFLLLPRIYLQDFLSLDIQSETGKKMIQSVFHAVYALSGEIEHTNIQMIINGGDYQDVKLLHIHLIEHNSDISPTKILQVNNNSIVGFSEIFYLAKHRIQHTEFSAYRLLFSFQENKIQLRLQMV